MAVLSGLLRISDGWSEMWENYLFVGWRLFDEIPLRRHGDPRSTVSTLSSKPSSGAFSYLFFKRFSVASISAPPKRIVEIPLPFPPSPSDLYFRRNRMEVHQFSLAILFRVLWSFKDVLEMERYLAFFDNPFHGRNGMEFHRFQLNSLEILFRLLQDTF